MIDAHASEEEKLRQGRETWERAFDHYEEANAERRLVSRFYHNTGGRGQWDASDVADLEEEGRPVLAFNLVKPKLEGVLGMMDDVRQRPIVAGVGAEDKLAADVLNALLEAVRREVKIESSESSMSERGVVEGEADYNLAVEPDPKDPSRVRFLGKRVAAREVQWDLGSELPDRSDARELTWSKWLSLGEFKAAYPKHRKEAEDWFKEASDALGEESLWDGDLSESPVFGMGDRDYSSRTTDSLYFDRRRSRMRVVHIEYRVEEPQWNLVAGPGIAEPVSDELVPVVRKMQDAGVAFEGMELVQTWVPRVYWFEFIRDHVLYDGPSPDPWDGFSIDPFTAYLDWLDNTSYGLVRNLVDPQRELNKAKSQELDHVISQPKPGYIAEEGAIADVDGFEEDVATGASVALVNKGALATNAVREREVPTPSPAATQRAQDSVVLFDRASGVLVDLDKPAAAAEAAATVQLRWRKAQLGLSKVFLNWNLFQMNVAEKIVQALQRVVPDHQIEEMLGSQEKYVVRGGVVFELEKDEKSGRRKPTGKRVELRDVRAMRFQIELDVASQNNSLRLLELQALQELGKFGFPVDPSVAVEKAVTSRYDRERLQQFVRETSQAQAAQQRAEAQMLARQVEQGFRVQMADAAEKGRHNRADEAIQATKVGLDHHAKIATVWEKADAEEKSLLLGILDTLERRQESRERTTTDRAKVATQAAAARARTQPPGRT